MGHASWLEEGKAKIIKSLPVLLFFYDFSH